MGIRQQFFDVSIAEFMDVINTNIGWNFMLVREAAKQMRKNGGGSVVFVNSNTAYRAIPDRIAYSASKSGALGMMRALALDLGKYHIRVNAVLPGMIKTDRWESNYNNCREALSNYTPLGDIADFEDIANAVWYLAATTQKYNWRRTCSGRGQYDTTVSHLIKGLKVAIVKKEESRISGPPMGLVFMDLFSRKIIARTQSDFRGILCD